MPAMLTCSIFVRLANGRMNFTAFRQVFPNGHISACWLSILKRLLSQARAASQLVRISWSAKPTPVKRMPIPMWGWLFAIVPNTVTVASL